MYNIVMCFRVKIVRVFLFLQVERTISYLPYAGVAKQRGHSAFIASTSFLGVLFNLHPSANQNRVFTKTMV